MLTTFLTGALISTLAALAGPATPGPDAYRHLDAFCRQGVDDAWLAALDADVAAGDIEADDLLPAFNMHGAMYGYVFRRLPALNDLFYKGLPLPAACAPLIARHARAAEVPRAFGVARDAFKQRWRRLHAPTPSGPPPSSATLAALAECDLEPPLPAPRTGVVLVGDRHAAWTTRGHDHVLLVSGADDAPDVCLTYTLPAAPPPTATFLGDAFGPKVAAAALAPDGHCETDCPVAVAYLPPGKPARVSLLDLDCGHDLRARKAIAFADRASLSLTCRASMGAAWRESQHLVHADDAGAARILLTVETGMHEVLSQGERDDGMCPIQPIGRMTIVSRGQAPVVETYGPSEPPGGEAGVALAQRFVWSREDAAFTTIGAPTKRDYDARRCAR